MLINFSSMVTLAAILAYGVYNGCWLVLCHWKMSAQEELLESLIAEDEREEGLAIARAKERGSTEEGEGKQGGPLSTPEDARRCRVREANLVLDFLGTRGLSQGECTSCFMLETGKSGPDSSDKRSARSNFSPTPYDRRDLCPLGARTTLSPSLLDIKAKRIFLGHRKSIDLGQDCALPSFTGSLQPCFIGGETIEVHIHALEGQVKNE